MRRIKKFRFKKNISIIWYILILIISYQLISFVLINVRLSDSNTSFINFMLEDSNYYLLYKRNNKNIFNYIFKSLVKINSPIRFNQKVDALVFNESNNPEVYIYNTHAHEKYLDGYLEGYNINPDIKMASQLLGEQLKKNGVNVLIDDNDIVSYMNNNNMDFYQSYNASRTFITKTLSKWPNLKLVIDLHRDALERDNSYVVLNDKSYAKILFVVGKKYDTYNDNLKLANIINDSISEKYPDITRGILLKERGGQNGVYNQDLSKKMILLELGSNNNTIDEINNTIELISPIIKEVINEI